MKIYKNGTAVFNSIDNTGSTNEASLGARYAKGRIDSLYNDLDQNYYTKEETHRVVDDAIDRANLLKAMVVAELPTVAAASPNIIYLVPVEGQDNVYSQYKKVLVSRNPDTYTMALLGSTQIEMENIQVTELPAATAVVGNKVFQYIGSSDVLVRGRFWWCAPLNYYAWDYLSGGTSSDEGTYYTASNPPAVGDDIYTGAWVNGEFIPTAFSKVVSVGTTALTDNKSLTYQRADTKDVLAYHWVPLLTKLSEFENDGDGTSPFITEAAANAALALKQNTITGAATTVAENNLTASRALVSNANGKIVASSITSTQLGYLSGAKSNIQTQIDNIASAGVSVSQFTVKAVAGSGANTSINDTSAVFRITIGNKNFLCGVLKLNWKNIYMTAGWQEWGLQLNFNMNHNTCVIGNISNVDIPFTPVIGYRGKIITITHNGISSKSNSLMELTLPMIPITSWS